MSVQLLLLCNMATRPKMFKNISSRLISPRSRHTSTHMSMAQIQSLPLVMNITVHQMRTFLPMQRMALLNQRFAPLVHLVEIHDCTTRSLPSQPRYGIPVLSLEMRYLNFTSAWVDQMMHQRCFVDSNGSLLVLAQRFSL